MGTSLCVLSLVGEETLVHCLIAGKKNEPALVNWLGFCIFRFVSCLGLESAIVQPKNSVWSTRVIYIYKFIGRTNRKGLRFRILWLLISAVFLATVFFPHYYLSDAFAFH